MADGQVTIPGTQSKVSRPVAYAGLAAVGVLIIVYYRNKKSQAAAPAATATDQYPPDGTTGNPADPYSTDPATGQTYGNEAAGSGGAYGAFGSGAASGMYYDPATGAYDLTSPYGTSPSTQPYQVQGGPPFSTNSAWSDWVIQELQAQNPNLDVGALTDALGLYLQGQPLNATQRTYAFDAEAIAGPPPVAGPNGFPPNVRGDGSTGGGTGGTTVTVPDVVGLTVGAAHNKMVAAGLAPGNEHYNTSLIVTGQSPKAGAQVPKGTRFTLTVGGTGGGGGGSTVTVPDVVGQTVGRAHNILVGAGLKPSGEHINTNWKVTAQAPRAGAKVARGTRFTLTAKP